MKNSGQKKEPNRGLKLLYRLTHYSSYHAYRRKLSLVRGILWFALILFVLGTILENYRTQFVVYNSVIFLLGIYLIGTYTVTAKASVMFKDSAKVMQSIAFEGVVSHSWNIYDGIYGNPNSGEYSVEIVFTKEKAFLTSLINILRKKPSTLPLVKEDVLNLRDYVQILTAYKTEERSFKVYSTLSDKMAEELAAYGMNLTQIENRYRDKPFRWDYARATGKIGDAFAGYPRDWKVYLLSYSELSDADKKSVSSSDSNQGQRYFNMNDFNSNS